MASAALSSGLAVGVEAFGLGELLLGTRTALCGVGRSLLRFGVKLLSIDVSALGLRVGLGGCRLLAPGVNIFLGRLRPQLLRPQSRLLALRLATLAIARDERDEEDRDNDDEGRANNPPQPQFHRLTPALLHCHRCYLASFHRRAPAPDAPLGRAHDVPRSHPSDLRLTDTRWTIIRSGV